MLILLFSMLNICAQPVKFKITAIELNDKGGVDKVTVRLEQPEASYLAPAQVLLHEGAAISAGAPNLKITKGNGRIVVDLDIIVVLHDGYGPFLIDGEHSWEGIKVKSSFDELPRGRRFIPIIVSEKQVLGIGLDYFMEDEFIKEWEIKQAKTERLKMEE